MAKRISRKKFTTETEEAAWWYENRKMISRDLAAAAKTGTLKVLDRKTILSRIKTPTSKVVTIRLPVSDIDSARQQAEERGLPYQTYMKSLLHQALARNAKAS
jgi:predicted DNA binding CopG/RHH family protein